MMLERTGESVPESDRDRQDFSSFVLWTRWRECWSMSCNTSRLSTRRARSPERRRRPRSVPGTALVGKRRHFVCDMAIDEAVKRLCDGLAAALNRETQAQQFGEQSEMTDASSKAVPKPARSRWTSFVGRYAKGRAVRGLEEEGNPKHRVRVEHNKHTLLVHISNEDASGWTTLAIDRSTREWAIAQRDRQREAAEAAYERLYASASKPQQPVAAGRAKTRAG